jgi:uncharacterized protein YdaU (DUF1376 family)
MSLAYFPMFPTDFDADTGHLTFAEDGAYNRLLRLSWKCPDAKMPDDLDWICRKARAVTVEDRALVEGILAEFFTRRGGKVFSKRLAEEWSKAHEAHAKRISAGSAGGKAKAMKKQEVTPSNAKAMLKQPEPEPDPSSFGSNEPQETRVLQLVPEAAKPRDRFDDFWAVYPSAGRVGKKAAAVKFAGAVKSGVLADRIIEAAERYSQTDQVQRGFAKHAATWLNQGCWDDELPGVAPPPRRVLGPGWGEVVR